ncbi:MAG: TonB-dependent receptor [Gammaproteobacteria bacterium]|nr:TonB-dependent receptor [Gammaproteobacteria bacterium]
MTDYSLVVGLKGDIDRLSYDISASLGENEAEYFLHNSVNPSWGPDSPTSFELGSYIQRETNINIDVAYMADVGLASDLNVAAGLEWREERFEITRGQLESWDKGEYIFSGSRNGSNGFNGFGPTAEGQWDRENVAAYLDLEVDVQPNWTIGGAVRWEDFDDFGTETTAKVSTRIQASEVLALRGSAGTGFRAPTPGQQNAYNVSTIFDPITVEPVDSGTVPSNSALAKQFGGETLEPEESDNFTVGAIFELGALNVTVDYFRIDVDDRIFLSEQIKIQDVTGAKNDDGEDIGDGQVDGYEHVDIADVQGFDSIRFFENDFDTKTDGFDIVLTYELESNVGDTDFLLSYNRTETEVTQSSNLSAGGIRWLEHGAPSTRYSATVNHEIGSCRYLLRYHHFGDWYSGYDGEDYDGYGLVDIGYTHRINSHASVSVGSDNVLDETPDRSVRRFSRGNKYPRFSPGGINGRFLYARARLEF